MTILARELQTGLVGLRGTHIGGTLRVPQTVVNEVLGMSRGVAHGVQLEIHSGNRILVHYGVLHINAMLADAAVGTPPKLIVLLASTIVAWTIKAAVKLPYMRVDGRHVIVDVGAIPEIGPYRALLSCITALKLATSPGVLMVHFEAQVEAN